MTKSNRPSASGFSSVDTNEPHFGDLRKGAFLRRLNAYRARVGADAGLAGYRYVDAHLALEPSVT